MKYINYVVIIVFCSCSYLKSFDGKNEVLKTISESQHTYYKEVLQGNMDFTGLVNFSNKKRPDLYRKNNIRLGQIYWCIV